MKTNENSHQNQIEYIGQLEEKCKSQEEKITMLEHKLKNYLPWAALPQECYSKKTK